MFFFSDHLHVASMSDSPLLDSGVETAVESNASNGLFNLESNTVESPVPEVYWTTFLQSFAAETVSFGDVAHFVLQYAHHRLPLVWPSGAELRFASSEMLGISEEIGVNFMHLTVPWTTPFTELRTPLMVSGSVVCADLTLCTLFSSPSFRGVFSSALCAGWRMF